MIRLIPILAIFLFASPAVFPCDCEYQGSFLKVSKNSSFIALVKVKKYLTFKEINGQQIPMSMEVKIIDIYKGSESNKTITVWGDPGNLCRPYLSEFKKGEYYMIAFSPAGKYSYEKKTEYSISICGAYTLSVDRKKKIVTGDIDSENKTFKSANLSELKSALKKNGY